jgi:dTDP-4-amino-4,6-dideoxygalactose transaminase
MKVPFLDLTASYPLIRKEIESGIAAVIDSASFILGNQVKKFESEFADFCETKYCVGVASGTDALHLSLRALDIGDGDEVITVANTFVATALAISYVGADIVLVDCDANTYNIDVNQIRNKITKKTKAIIPVHLYGQAANMPEIMSLAKEHNIKVVEDASQAHGARVSDARVGTFGDLACFSFYPGKNLGAFGDGGAIVTSDENLKNKLEMLRNYGSPQKYFHDFIGFNSRLDSIQAVVLSAKLKYLDLANQKRKEHAKRYSKNLSELPELTLPKVNNFDSHVFHLYVIQAKDRDGLSKFLLKNEIQTVIHYPNPIYRLGAYQSLGLNSTCYPNTEKYSSEILSLPMYPEISNDQIDFVCEIIKKYYGKK